MRAPNAPQDARGCRHERRGQPEAQRAVERLRRSGPLGRHGGGDDRHAGQVGQREGEAMQRLAQHEQGGTRRRGERAPLHDAGQGADGRAAVRADTPQKEGPDQEKDDQLRRHRLRPQGAHDRR